jgi:hypothetical protein
MSLIPTRWPTPNGRARPRAISSHECIRRDIERRRLSFDGFESGPNILGSSDFQRRNFYAERTSPCLNLIHLNHGFGKSSIEHNRQSAQVGYCLTQERQSLAFTASPAMSLFRMDPRAGKRSPMSGRLRSIGEAHKLQGRFKQFRLSDDWPRPECNRTHERPHHWAVTLQLHEPLKYAVDRAERGSTRKCGLPSGGRCNQ